MDSSTVSFMLRERPEEKATLERVVGRSSFGVRAAANAGAEGGMGGRGMPWRMAEGTHPPPPPKPGSPTHGPSIIASPAILPLQTLVLNILQISNLPPFSTYTRSPTGTMPLSTEINSYGGSSHDLFSTQDTHIS